MTDILEGALNPRVAPRRVLLGHPQDQPPDLGEHARTTAPPLRVRPLPRDQLPMPAENRVGRDDRRDLTEAATAQPVPVPRQPTAFFIGQAEPAAHVPAEDAVFFDEVGHGVLLPLVEPADQRRQEHSEGQRVEHGGRVYTTDPISGPQDLRPSNETLRAPHSISCTCFVPLSGDLSDSGGLERDELGLIVDRGGSSTVRLPPPPPIHLFYRDDLMISVDPVANMLPHGVPVLDASSSRMAPSTATGLRQTPSGYRAVLWNVCAAVRNSGTIVVARVEATMPCMRTYPCASGSTT